MCAIHAAVGPVPLRWRRTGALIAVVSALAWAPPAAAAAPCHSLAATNMVFTNYSPLGAGVAATFTVTYNCPAPIGLAWLAVTTPTPRTMAGPGSTLQYDVTQDANHTVVWPSTPPVPIDPALGSVTVYGFLPGSQNAPAGTYTGTLAVAIYTNAIGTQTDATTLTVSTTGFLSTCIISPGTLAFGNYDPFSTNAVTPRDAQGSLQIACSKGAPYAVGLGTGNFAAGATRQMANGAQRLAYELYTDAGRSTVWNTINTVGGTAASITPFALTVYGRIPPGQNVIAGAYGDTVQATINF